jgi:hypothetical protein
MIMWSDSEGPLRGRLPTAASVLDLPDRADPDTVTFRSYISNSDDS